MAHNRIDGNEITESALYSIAQSNIAVGRNIQKADQDNLRAVIVTNRNVAGINIPEFQRKFDQYKAGILCRQKSLSSGLSSVSDYYTKISDILSRPTDDPDVYERDIIDAFQDFLELVGNASVDINETIFQSELLVTSVKLADSVSGTQYKFAEMLDAVECDLATSINDVNNLIAKLHELSYQRNFSEKGTLAYCEIEEDIHQNLLALSEYFDIRHFYDSKGFLNIMVNDGEHKIVGESAYFIDYTQGCTLDLFAADKLSFSPIELIMIDQQNSDSAKQTIVAGGFGDECITKIVSGKIGGLLALRNQELPQLMTKLDALAYTLASSINSVHNKGANQFLSTMDGSHIVEGDSMVNAQGTAYLTLINQDGDAKAAAIDLQFATIATPGSHMVSVQAIADEINRLGNKPSRLSYGCLYDLQLASLSKTFDQDKIEFDLDLTFDIPKDSKQESNADPDLTFDIPKDSEQESNSATLPNNPEFNLNHVRVLDSLGNEVNVTLSGNKQLNIAPGARYRSSYIGGPKLILDNSTPLNYPLTIEIDTNLLENNENQPNRVIFQITPPTVADLENSNGLRNKRFSATRLRSETGDLVNRNAVSKIIQSQTGPLVHAGLVDPLTGSPATDGTGILQIASKVTNIRLAINSDSSQLSGLSDGKIVRSETNFSDFFGLNDLYLIRSNATADRGEFLTLEDLVRGAAKNFRIRSDIGQGPGRISFSKANNKGVGIFYNVHEGNTNLSGDYDEMAITKFKSPQIGDYPQLTGTIGQILDYFNKSANSRGVIFTKNYEQELNKFSNMQTDLQNLEGVEITDQLTKIEQLSQLQEANIAVLKIRKKQLDRLLELFN